MEINNLEEFKQAVSNCKLSLSPYISRVNSKQSASIQRFTEKMPEARAWLKNYIMNDYRGASLMKLMSVDDQVNTLKEIIGKIKVPAKNPGAEIAPDTYLYNVEKFMANASNEAVKQVYAGMGSQMQGNLLREIKYKKKSICGLRHVGDTMFTHVVYSNTSRDGSCFPLASVTRDKAALNRLKNVCVNSTKGIKKTKNNERSAG